MTCTKCGYETSDDTIFCPNCGEKVSDTETAAPAAPVAPVAAPEQPQPAAPQEVVITKEVIPDAYKPLSPWAYLGWQFLFSIPLVGFILLIVFSTGAARNRNLRNFARSYWCLLLLALIIAVVALLVVILLAVFLNVHVTDVVPNMAQAY